MALDIRGYDRADAQWVVDRHQTLYAQFEGFDDSFGPLVAQVLDEFDSAASPRAAGWVLMDDAMRVGTIFCTDAGDGLAQLRLFFTEPHVRGRGVGQMLFDRCRGFAAEQGYRGLFLWTHREHNAACALYARNGMALTQSRPVAAFGRNLTEQRFEMAF